jgi:hypothetical protein
MAGPKKGSAFLCPRRHIGAGIKNKDKEVYMDADSCSRDSSEVPLCISFIKDLCKDSF